MRWSALKYILPLITFWITLQSFTSTGFVVWIPVIYAFGLIPLLELFIKPDDSNLDATEEAIAKEDSFYDWILYLIVPLHYFVLFVFLSGIDQPGLSGWDRAGRILAMGLQCGIFGINVAHELGHRVKRVEQLLARSLLLTSLYMHFYIEHNRGHHKHVGTPQDPSTAPYNQSLYAFWFRSITGVYQNAWHISMEEQTKKNRPWWRNEMLQYQAIEIAFCLGIGLFFGWVTLLCFLSAALIGILLLETVNYIEHYGLARRQITAEKFERAMPEHSWNSNHVIGRLMLFELSRHSDHHYLASRKYQTLRHHDNSPQLPTGYPGSMLLALIPPLWFSVMNRRIANYNNRGIIHWQQPAAAAQY